MKPTTPMIAAGVTALRHPAAQGSTDKHTVACVLTAALTEGISIHDMIDATHEALNRQGTIEPWHTREAAIAAAHAVMRTLAGDT